MPRRRRLLPHEIADLKFDDCTKCVFAATKQCRSCDYGENFEPDDNPEEVCDLMDLWG